MRPLEGVTVIDAATLFAGPLAATMLGDFGAEVLKIEHPTKGDPARTHGPSKDGVGLWWTLLGRNKQTVALDLSTPAGADVLLRLAATADVLIENFRPGTLERWGVGPEQLHAVNPRLVIARVTGFGQKGPYASRPGFGTLAESMSGFAAITGEPDGPPTLPPFGLADGIAAQTVVDRSAHRALPPRRPGRRPARSSTSRSSSRSSRSSARSRRSTTSSGSSSSARATGRSTTRPATPTARATAAGSRSRPRRSPSPSA